MAKATAKEAARTRQKIIDAALAITINEGFEKVTLGRLAKAIGMSRSCINAHFPHRVNIANVLEPYLSKILYELLDFSSREAFSKSWRIAVQSDADFRASIAALGPIIPPHIGFKGLLELIDDPDKGAVTETIYNCLGYAVVYLSELAEQQALL